MRAVDLLRVVESVCRALADNGIDPRDVDNIKLYEDWVRMRKEGHKYQYIIYYLTTQYDKSESGVHRIIKRMEREL